MARRRPLTPPTVSEAILDGWRPVDQSTESVFDSPFVSVVAATVVYEDGVLKDAVEQALGLEFTPRFFFATRLALDPAPPGSSMLDRFVAMRARDGFAERLRERGFVDVRAVDHRRHRVDGADEPGDLYRYAARCVVDGVSVDATGWAAVWPVADAYLFAGGAYPTSVDVEASAIGEEAAASLAALFDPDEFRTELLELIRHTA